MQLPNPVDLGLPAKFASWYPNQPEAVAFAIDDPHRFRGLVLPTGSGKSLIYMAVSRLTDWRTVILTSTKALQDQLTDDFAEDGYTCMVKGQSAYICKALEPGGELVGQFDRPKVGPVMVDHGPCHVGATCSLQQHGCSYWDAVHAAAQFPVVITNYAWWLTLVQNPSVVLRPTLLVLDEAHAAPDALADALGAEILRESVESVLHLELPAADRLEPAAWVAWATQTAARLSARIDGARAVNHDTAKKLRAGQYLLMALRRIGQLDARLLVVSDTNQGVRFDVVWAAPHAEDWLFRGARHVLLVSATFTPHTAELLGIMDKDLGLLDAGSGFPLARRPVYIAPALHGVWHKPVRVDHRMTDEQQVAWVQHVDRILASRADRKGIIHSVSYARRDLILSRSKYRDRMMTHTKSDTAAQIRKFKASRAGTVLVSPAVTTGYDFPYQEAEFQIVAKVPFPDARHPIIAARTLIDKRYPAHLAMQQLVQMTGRGMRAADDQCETFIVDDHARWFLSSHADLAPRWFRRAITRLDKSVPAPPPPLGRRTGAAAFQE